MCKAIELGKLIINECIDRGYVLNTSKLQKLLFYMQKASLKQFDEEKNEDKKNNGTIFSEKIIAHKCGPVIEEVRQWFRNYNIGITPNDRQNAQLVLLDEEKAVFEDVLSFYGNKSPMELIELSQQELSWIKTWCDGAGEGKPISTNDIKNM